jgi:hypothetical protein
MAEKQINGRTFKVEPLLATRAIRLQARLFRLAGPAISRLGDIMQGYGTDKTEEQKMQSNVAAMAAFSAIFADTDPDELAMLIQELVETAQLKRPSGTYDMVDMDGDLTGHSQDLIPLVVFVLREQFGDFFSGLLELGGPRRTTGR